MSSILTNSSAMVALDTLRGINKNLASVQSEISTGKKISSSMDNAAIWSISTVMQSDVESFSQITDSLNLGSATVGVARAGANEVTELLKTARNAIVSANDASVTDADRAKYNTDLTELTATVNSIVDAASSNGQNLLKGEGEIEVLASLNRQSDGTVSTGNVEIARQNLQTNAAVTGVAAVEASTVTDGSAGGITFADGAVDAGVVAETITNGDPGGITFADGTITDSATEVVTLNGGATVTEGSVYSFDIGGQEITYTAANGDDINDVGAGLVAAVTAAGIAGITGAETTPAVDPETNDYVFTLSNASGGDVTVDNAASEIAALATTELVTLNGGAGSVTTGSTYEFDIDGTTVSYTALEGDDINAVNEGIVAAINDEGITGVTAAVTTPADDALADDATFTITNATAAEVEVDGATTDIVAADEVVAVEAGGLEALANLDISTEAGALEALNAIDALLQTAIDATAYFGSKQTRLSNQNEFVTTLTDSLKTGIGALTDANLEEASARLQSLQVQQQLGVQALSIANSGPQQLLALFQ
ncbi:MAG: flagellin [Alphaproteobacteria bacterium]